MLSAPGLTKAVKERPCWKLRQCILADSVAHGLSSRFCDFAEMQTLWWQDGPTQRTCWEPPVSSACFLPVTFGCLKSHCSTCRTFIRPAPWSGHSEVSLLSTLTSSKEALQLKPEFGSASSLSFLTPRRYISAPRVTAEHRAGSQEYSINYITPPGASLAWKCRRTTQDSNNEKSPVKASSNLWWRESVHLAFPSAHNSKRGDSFWTIYVNYLSKWGAIQNRWPQAKIHSRSVEMADA